LISVRSSLKTLVAYLLLPVFDRPLSYHCDLQTVLFCLNFAESGGEFYWKGPTAAHAGTVTRYDPKRPAGLEERNLDASQVNMQQLR